MGARANQLPSMLRLSAPALAIAWLALGAAPVAAEQAMLPPLDPSASIMDHLRAGQLLDSGQASVSELRPGTVDEAQLQVYQASALKDRLRAGQSLDSGALSISELRPGNVDQSQLQVYLAMADAPREMEISEASEALVFLAAMSIAGGSEPVTLQTASGIVMRAGLMPRSVMGADGVWEFPRLPDSDERDLLVAEKWRVVENMESQILFLGPDREFGLDDFLDVVNPLQHIPLINIAYRAVTGDEIHGAAQLLDLGLGPIAGVSTVFNLALRESTGATMEDYAMAAMFGPVDIFYDDDDGYLATTAAGDLEQVATMVRRGSIR